MNFSLGRSENDVSFVPELHVGFDNLQFGPTPTPLSKPLGKPGTLFVDVKPAPVQLVAPNVISPQEGQEFSWSAQIPVQWNSITFAEGAEDYYYFLLVSVWNDPPEDPLSLEEDEWDFGHAFTRQSHPVQMGEDQITEVLYGSDFYGYWDGEGVLGILVEVRGCEDRGHWRRYGSIGRKYFKIAP